MIVFKKILVIKETQESNTYAILKFENINDKTNINVRIVSALKGDFILLIKIDNNIYDFHINKTDDIKFDNKIDLNKIISAILIYNNEIVSFGSTKGYFDYIEIYNNYLKEKELIQQNEKIEEDIKTEEPLQEFKEIEKESIKNEEEQKSKKEPFFNKIKSKIEELFSAYKEDKELMKLIPNSKWVRVDITNDSYYVVGIIYANDQPALICYGVPDKDDKNPPNNDKKCMQWFKINDGGYWMMYQSAIDGKTLTNDEIII